jgi:N6-L-threonylcarbamoyladenine synthase
MLQIDLLNRLVKCNSKFMPFMQNLRFYSCAKVLDDTAAAILQNDKVLSNVVANQLIHNQYGGVVPELASRKKILFR